MLGSKFFIVLFFVVFALLAQCQEPPSSASLDTKRAYMIGRMNQVRAKQNSGLVSLYMDSALNSIAQGHAEDMAKRNFFSHTNPDGLSPQQRADKAGFGYGVGQNIAYGGSLSKIHTNLMNSPPHFANTIGKEWTRAGVGIYYKGQTIYVAIVFSVRDIARYPITAAQKATVLSKVSAYITKKNNSVKTKIDSLSTHITNWLNANRKPSSVFDYLKSVKYPITKMAFEMAQADWSPNLVDNLIKDNYFEASSAAFTKYGIGMNVGPTGKTIIAVVFAV